MRYQIAFAAALAFSGEVATAQVPGPQSASYFAGRFLIILPPDYPPEALAAGQTGSVQVAGRVLVDGSIEKPRFTSTPPNPTLEAAVARVLEYWRLQPRVTDECRFEAADIQVTIWFDIADGHPKVSYSRPVPPAPDAALVAAHEDAWVRKIVKRAPLRYPRDVARNRNTPDEVSQLAFVAVGPDGLVKSVSVAPKRYYASFEKAIVASLSQWRFEPSESGLCAEVPIVFRLT